MTDTSQKYLVWSNEHNAWWRPDYCGYTNHIQAAGRYSREVAVKICTGANYGFARGERPNEIPVLELDAMDAIGERPTEEGTW